MRRRRLSIGEQVRALCPGLPDDVEYALVMRSLRRQQPALWRCEACEYLCVRTWARDLFDEDSDECPRIDDPDRRGYCSYCSHEADLADA